MLLLDEASFTRSHSKQQKYSEWTQAIQNILSRTFRTYWSRTVYVPWRDINTVLQKEHLPKAKEQIASAFASKLGKMVWTAFFTCVNWNFWDYFQGETDVSQRGRESSSCINGLLLSLSQLLFSWDFWLLYLQPATTGWRCRAGLSLCEFAYSNECVW